MVIGTGKPWISLKDINWIWENFQNIRIISPILGNETFNLLYSKFQMISGCVTPSGGIGVTQLDIIQKTTTWSLELKNIKNFEIN